ncbi:hypothetical protein B0T14DRAFT_107781 [Immersiella caudata]|uniref:Uncharacterized protein n=1 Tax=Immersiella caudata TaxID=314043 RepID=A0AA39X3C5_9PEZI|nr:hypothetical protein B0T14DRAFT_107781 [Immersiella caudata]
MKPPRLARRRLFSWNMGVCLLGHKRKASELVASPSPRRQRHALSVPATSDIGTHHGYVIGRKRGVVIRLFPSAGHHAHLLGSPGPMGHIAPEVTDNVNGNVDSYIFTPPYHPHHHSPQLPISVGMSCPFHHMPPSASLPIQALATTPCCPLFAQFFINKSLKLLMLFCFKPTPPRTQEYLTI